MRPSYLSCRSAATPRSLALALVMAAMVGSGCAAQKQATPGYGGDQSGPVTPGDRDENMQPPSPTEGLTAQQQKGEGGPPGMVTGQPRGGVSSTTGSGGASGSTGGGGDKSAIPLVQREEEEERLLLAILDGGKPGAPPNCGSICSSVAKLQQYAKEGCEQSVSSGSTCAQGKAKAAEMAARARTAGCPCPDAY